MKKKLSRFQKNMNDFTFYLLIMLENISAKDLQFYDSDSPFSENFDLLKKLDNELKDLIQDDKDLLINQNLPSGKTIRSHLYSQFDNFKGQKNVKRNFDKDLNLYLQNKYLEYSKDFPTSYLDTNKKVFISISITLFVICLFLLTLYSFLNKEGVFLLVTLFGISIYFLNIFISYKKTLQNKNSPKRTYKHKFRTSYCYEKMIKAKDVLKQVLFENNPFERLEENKLYRQIIKESPVMKTVFKVMIENNYWHYDGYNVVQTEKSTKQVLGKLSSDTELGINRTTENWKKAFGKLLLLPKPVYKYEKTKDDKTWNHIQELIKIKLEELSEN